MTCSMRCVPERRMSCVRSIVAVFRSSTVLVQQPLVQQRPTKTPLGLNEAYGCLVLFRHARHVRGAPASPADSVNVNS